MNIAITGSLSVPCFFLAWLKRVELEIKSHDGNEKFWRIREKGVLSQCKSLNSESFLVFQKSIRGMHLVILKSVIKYNTPHAWKII